MSVTYGVTAVSRKDLRFAECELSNLLILKFEGYFRSNSILETDFRKFIYGKRSQIAMGSLE